jgi:hypothetical protein
MGGARKNLERLKADWSEALQWAASLDPECHLSAFLDEM